MRFWRALAVSLIPVALLSILTLRVCCLEHRLPVWVQYRETAGSLELPTEEDRSVQAEAEGRKLPTSADVQSDTGAAETQTPPKPVNPAVDLTLLRRTSVGQVRAG